MSRTTRLALFLPLSLAFALAPVAEEPSFHAAEGTELVRTFTSETVLELDDMSVTLDGNDHTFGEPELSLEGASTRVVADVFGPPGEGRPQRLVRTFQTLEGNQVESSTMPSGESGTEQTASSSELEDRVVAFVWDEDEGEYSVAFDDDGEEDGELLEGLVEDMDLRLFLPGEEVGEDDSWDVDVAAFRRINTPGGVNLVDEGSEDPERELEFERALDRGVDGELTATFRGLRDEAGRRVAVIAIEAEIETEAEQPQDRDDREVIVIVSLSYDMQGELLWDMQGGHLFSFELSGAVEYVRVEESVFIGPNGDEFEVVQTMSLSGDHRVEATVERR